MNPTAPIPLSDLVPNVVPTADAALAQRLQHRLDRKTKPLGALGRLETLALQLGLIQGSEAPALREPQLLVFAGDHGLAARGVSAYPQDVTWQMVENMLAGGAAVSVLARQHGLALAVVDAGVAHEFAPRPGLVIRKVAPGTRDAASEPAMTAAQCAQALLAGRELVRERPGNALLLGEMGIANTSSASLLMARLTGLPIAQCTGRGTGLDDAGVARKTAVLDEALRLHAQATAPLDALAALGGFEIAMMAGAVLQAAHERRVVVVDGFITSAAVLVAQALAPAVRDYCVWSHRSGESGHARLLEALGGVPLLELGLRLGEGSGAALAWPLVDSAARLLEEMASFESAGVSDREG
ncbi:nicotinate-nucleotide--dimethylbenzimidazole phosphoribosyltransferase [Caldimonas tepidiphila]|uniref:nicotinate-nucleotide--dimethylbenzimidazole phosphoribosyltransferase n=1 Tax=Caldimonas tepidiphila TaxID=2315841 RepID=UPI000E5BB6E8|nr:nicotinate-nucleotide--dimethylbenzimidazole phosphoribosyltransferase [Caldimonas tepidiphila]